MVLLDEVIQIFDLPHDDGRFASGIDLIHGRLVGATHVDSDLLWHIVQVDGTFQKSPGRKSTVSPARSTARSVHQPARLPNDAQWPSQ